MGAFARYAAGDRVFPRTASRLYLLLLRYEGMPAQRDGAKVAHREWRRVRKHECLIDDARRQLQEYEESRA